MKESQNNNSHFDDGCSPSKTRMASCSRLSPLASRFSLDSRRSTLASHHAHVDFILSPLSSLLSTFFTLPAHQNTLLSSLASRCSPLSSCLLPLTFFLSPQSSLFSLFISLSLASLLSPFSSPPPQGPRADLLLTSFTSRIRLSKKKRVLSPSLLAAATIFRK